LASFDNVKCYCSCGLLVMQANFNITPGAYELWQLHCNKLLKHTLLSLRSLVHTYSTHLQLPHYRDTATTDFREVCSVESLGWWWGIYFQVYCIHSLHFTVAGAWGLNFNSEDEAVRFLDSCAVSYILHTRRLYAYLIVLVVCSLQAW